MTTQKNVGWVSPKGVTRQDEPIGQNEWSTLPIDQVADVNPRLDKSAIPDQTSLFSTLTYLLFLKMADERTKAPYNQKSPVPEKYSWPSLIKKDGDTLFDHYRHTLEALGNQKGLLGLIFNKSQNKFQDPAKLRRLIVNLVDAGCYGTNCPH